MKARIVRIGNSQGIRIPKPLLDQTGLVGEVELEVEDGAIVIRRTAERRSGWDEAFRSMADAGDDALLDTGSVGPDWDSEEWVW
ncbi:MAG: AbrB/MazE/SpoVT family DNA-binding domain-containing protein [Gemmatimonadota bacterium]